MGLLKKIFGDAIDSLENTIEAGRFVTKSVKEMLRVDSNKEYEGTRVEHDSKFKGGASNKSKSTKEESRKEDNAVANHAAIDDTVKKTYSEERSGKFLWWVEHLEFLFTPNKYALKYTGGTYKKETDYIYDDVDLLSEYQARVAQRQADGSFRYGVASTYRGFIVTGCDYIKVTYLDGYNAVLAVDEDGDEYAIDMFGDIYSIERYREKIEEELNDV